MKKNKILSLILISALTINANAFDLGKFLTDLFSNIPVAGDKAVEADNKNDKGNAIDVDVLKEQNGCRAFYPWGAPKITNKNLISRSLYICKSNFAIMYDPQTKTPVWTSEWIETNNVVNSFDIDINGVILDSRVPKNMQSSVNIYKGEYTFASMAYPGDLFIERSDLGKDDLKELNKKIIGEAMEVTNIVPMIKENLANTIWKELNQQTRKWAVQKESGLHVVTGTIYYDGKTKGFLNNNGNKTAIPTHFFKIIVHPNSYGSVAYIIPNTEIVTAETKKINNPQTAYYCGGSEKRFCTLSDFTTSIKEVERLSGMEFFPLLAPYHATQIKMDINQMNKNTKGSK